MDRGPIDPAVECDGATRLAFEVTDTLRYAQVGEMRIFPVLIEHGEPQQEDDIDYAPAGELEWSSSDQGIAAVSAGGQIDALAAGTATITVRKCGLEDVVDVVVTRSLPPNVRESCDQWAASFEGEAIPTCPSLASAESACDTQRADRDSARATVDGCQDDGCDSGELERLGAAEDAFADCLSTARAELVACLEPITDLRERCEVYMASSCVEVETPPRCAEALAGGAQ